MRPPLAGLRRTTRWLLCAAAILLSAGAIFAVLQYRAFFRVPSTRLALGRYYPWMPPDRHHRYLALPVDHHDPGHGLFQGYYLLSPNFKPSAHVVFLLTDGQMELVNPHTDFDYFDRIIPGASYVLIGVRGQAPAIFPEVFRSDGSLDLATAIKLYSSSQQVEDIEAVRRDLERSGDLPTGGKISVFGASGAGVLAQQYLSKYGEHVDRALLEVTGAPDLSARKGWSYSRDLASYSPQAAAEFERAAISSSASTRASLAYVLYQLARNGNDGRRQQLQALHSFGSSLKLGYSRRMLHPQLNLWLVRWLLSSPAEAMVKVRWYELAGGDLERYARLHGQPINLLCEFSLPVLSEFVAASHRGEIAPPQLHIDRHRFQGETLVLSGDDDIVFDPAIGQAIAAEYPRGRWLLLHGGHHLSDQSHVPRLRQAFFSHGSESQLFKELLRDPLVVKVH